MSLEGYTPTPVTKFGSLVTAFPRENLALGVSPDNRNVRFTLDTVATRFGMRFAAPGGFQTGANPPARITGLSILKVSSGLPNTPTVNIPIVFDAGGQLWFENPPGSGLTTQIPPGELTLPLNSYKQDTQVAGREYMAFSDLKVGIGPGAVYDGATLAPFTQLPYGSPWAPLTAYIVGEVITPRLLSPNEAGYGHTYKCIQAGTSLANPPIFPTSIGSTVTEPGGPEWQESTITISNCLSAAAYGVGVAVTPAGSLPLYDVYVQITLTNAAGESLPSPAPYVIHVARDGYLLTVSLIQPAAPVDWQLGLPAPYAPTGFNVYTAKVASGDPVPDISTYHLQTSVGTLGGNYTVLVGALNTSGVAPVSVPTAGITPFGAVPTGTRYGTILFTNTNGDISGFSLASVVMADALGENLQLYVRNLPPGPPNVVNRIIALTVQGSVAAGPYFYNGINTRLTTGQWISSMIIPEGPTSATITFTDEALASVNVTAFTDKIKLPAQANVFFSSVVNCLLCCGEAGQPSLVRVSAPFNYETFYGSTGYYYVSNKDGERVIGWLDWRNQLVTFKERSAWSVRSVSGAAPVNWVLLPMWRSAGDEGVGPCGPRAYAGCPDFIVFANRKGAFIYTGSGVPVWITKEIQTQSSSGPNRPTWDQINWAYEHLIVCAIDPESREVHFSVPFGGSTVPNKTFTVNYARGWDDPVHYSSFSGKEVTPPERKWTFSDWAGSSIMRVERPLTSPNPADPIDPRIAFSQLLIASPYADGTVNIQAPDEYDDNGVAINSYYDVSQIKAAAAINQFGGITINVKGQGKLSLSVIPLNGPLLPMRGIDLSADPRGFYKRETRANGRQFGLRVGNSNTQGAWFEMMECALFMKAQFPAENRDPGRAGP